MSWSTLLVAVAVSTAAFPACGSDGAKSRTLLVVAKDAHFSAVFPAPPVRHGDGHVIFYGVIGRGVEGVNIVYATDNQGELTGSNLRSTLDGLPSQAAAKGNGVVRQQSATTYLGQPAVTAIITFSKGLISRFMAVVFGGRDLYILSNLYPFDGDDPKGDNWHAKYDQLLATFHII